MPAGTVKLNPPIDLTSSFDLTQHVVPVAMLFNRNNPWYR